MATITVGVNLVTEFLELYWQYVITPILYLIVAFIVTVKSAEKGINTRFEKWVRWFVVYPFVLFDWFVNQTAMVVLCFDWADDKTEVVTERMKRYKRAYGFVAPYRLIDYWRKFIVIVLCWIANKIAPGHCDI